MNICFLLIAMDFKLGDEEEESDYDMDSMEVDESSSKQNTDKQNTEITPDKRKAEVGRLNSKLLILGNRLWLNC